MNALRQGLPELPARMARLPIDARGYPVPWFVGWVDVDGRPLPRGQGTPDFRVIQGGAIAMALYLKSCWLCGEPLGAFKTFVIGPMCAINRVSSEPPSHLDCADFAARACPFLVRPNQRRNTHGLPEDTKKAAGCGIARNPGVTLVWTTKSYRARVVRAGQGIASGLLIQVGDPEHVRWYREAREATRAEVLESIESGLPVLREDAERQKQGAPELLDQYIARAMKLLPEPEPSFHGTGSFE